MPRARWCLRVRGIVQGVGFRPTVWRYAAELDLAGSVRNEGADVLIEIEGETKRLELFLERLRHSPPPLARIRSVETEEKPPTGETGFKVATSVRAATVRRIAPDTATCAACLAEISDPSQRRFRYPFTNCTDCGPRYTIITDLPYDRPNTSMAGFPLCPDCRREYEDPSDRRFHAQPIACPRCGPAVTFRRGEELVSGPEALKRSAKVLAEEEAVLAVKGLGGYHIACLAESGRAVERLRRAKGREAKPFAVMVPTLRWAERLAEIPKGAERLLTGPEKPIVLLKRRFDTPESDSLSDLLAPGLDVIGLFLPYTPLHAILLEDVGRPLVMTSGNLTDDPIAYTEEDARGRLSALVDGFLEHNRPIVRRCEDSVAALVAGRPVLFRRARGYAPAPLRVERRSEADILAVGAHLKNTFCFLKGEEALVGPHIGDLHHLRAYEQFKRDIEDLARLLEVTPEAAAYDLHPDYLSTRYALALPDRVLKIPVQHHHAHIVSCLAENGVEGPVIGVAFDGLGMGPQGELWGGEFLIATPEEFRRVGFIEPLLLPGGEKAVREGWRVAAACLLETRGPEGLRRESLRLFPGRPVEALLKLVERKFNCPSVTSAGRLFDVVAALSGLCEASSYEGEAPMRLEQKYAARSSGPDYRLPVIGSHAPWRISWRPLVDRILEDRADGADLSVISTRFHRGLAAAVRTVCMNLRREFGLREVALSGGVFHNKVLCELVTGRLLADGFKVHLHREVPPGDGGISLGQAVIADRKAKT